MYVNIHSYKLINTYYNSVVVVDQICNSLELRNREHNYNITNQVNENEIHILNHSILNWYLYKLENQKLNNNNTM